MKSEMQEFCLRASVPCGFSDSEGEISTNAAMMELLAFNKDAPEMEDLLEKIRTEKSPFYVISNLTFDYKKPPKLWQIDFIPVVKSSNENSYLGTFFHAHEFLFLSPLEYVDGMEPYTVTMQQPDDLLSHREWQIVFLMMHRFSSKEIGRRLDIFPSTVESHVKAIYRKVNVHSACQLREFGKSKGFERYIPLQLLSSDKRVIKVSNNHVN